MVAGSATVLARPDGLTYVFRRERLRSMVGHSIYTVPSGKVCPTASLIPSPTHNFVPCIVRAQVTTAVSESLSASRLMDQPGEQKTNVSLTASRKAPSEIQTIRKVLRLWLFLFRHSLVLQDTSTLVGEARRSASLLADSLPHLPRHRSTTDAPIRSRCTHP